ncbi:hypothetical protein OK016_24075 [Vibrio chagasii]|nr:hypothetical protein [Vibrio chagasii]
MIYRTTSPGAMLDVVPVITNEVGCSSRHLTRLVPRYRVYCDCAGVVSKVKAKCVTGDTRCQRYQSVLPVGH